MFTNPFFIPAILGTVTLFFLSFSLSRHFISRKSRLFIIMFSFFAIIPALSFILYYLHIFNEPIWYISFRSLYYVDLLNCSWGLLYGVIASLTKGKNAYFKITVFFLGSLCFCSIPFLKPLLHPLYESQFKVTWLNDVCMQSTGSTCGPCSFVTLMKVYGKEFREVDIAKNSYSSKTGTENWYIIRYARKLGIELEPQRASSIDDVPFPAIIGTTLKQSGAGHFVVLLERNNGKYIIGDSLLGRLEMTPEEFKKRFKFSRSYLFINRT